MDMRALGECRMSSLSYGTRSGKLRGCREMVSSLQMLWTKGLTVALPASPF